MDSLDITCCQTAINISPIKRIGSRTISYKLPQISSFDQVGYLLLQLKAIFCIMTIILLKLTGLVLIPSKQIGLDLPRPLYKIFILNLYEPLYKDPPSSP